MSVIVEGTFVNAVTGEPNTGRGYIEPALTVLQDTGSGAVALYGQFFDLDETGSFSVVVMATDDPTLSPSGFTYRLGIRLTDGTPHNLDDIYFEAPQALGTIDVATMIPLGTPLEPTQYVELDARLDVVEAAGPGGGGGVTDHGALTGLADDDHAQYALADGTRGAFATPAQGTKADTAVQPAALSGYATAAQGTKADGAAQKSANLSDLASAPTARTNLGLGTAATTASTAYATAAQGTLASTAVQPAALSGYATSAQGAKADTAVQPATAQVLNAQTGTSYTLVAADAGKLVTLSNAGAITLNAPGSVFTAGQRVDVVVIGAGMATVVGTAGATANGTPSLVSRAQWSAFSVVALSATSFVVVGDMA